MAAFVARRAFTALKCVSVRCPSKIQIQKRQISFSRVLSTRLYSEKHEWLTTEGDIGTVGISEHAVDQLGEVVYVETPEVGTQLQPDDVAGCIESVKAASDVFSPVGGEVVEVNGLLSDNPNLLNDQPLEEGWLYKLKVDPGSDVSGLMDENAYKKFVEQSEH